MFITGGPSGRRRAAATMAGVALVLGGCGAAAPTAGQPTVAIQTDAPATPAATSGATPTEAPPAELTTIRYAFDWKCEGDWAPAVWGEKLGYFEEVGVDLEYREGQGSSAELPLLAAGDSDIGQIAAAPLVLSVPEGLPVTAVGVQMSATHLALIADGSISEPSDLEGKKVAVQEGEYEGAVWAAFAEATGIDRSQVEEIPASGEGDILLIDHQVDAHMNIYTSASTIALTDGREGEETIFLIKDYLPIIGLATVVNNDFLAENQEAVRGFLNAWAQGMKYTIDHPDETIDEISAICPEYDREELTWAVTQYIEFWQSDQAREGGFLSFTDEGWTATKDLLVQGGLMDDTDISGLYTDEYLPAEPIRP
jgi:NitT/TauT family transport system substrate-binding protein